jgi:GrpB-like predicted nucleotidyltransferase (UPF0157 family)
MRIEIHTYDPEWPHRFAIIGQALRTSLGQVAERIDHIGSTAVQGLAAKPIIDVQISVADFEPLEAYRLPLERLGYVFRAENLELTKRYFREAPGTPRTHIHVRRIGSWAEQYALLFRDYMRAHPAEANAYATIKRTLAAQLADNREAYTDAKQPYIWEIMGRADRWSQHVGWQPGRSDA